MIRINQCKLNIHHTDKELEDKICKLLKIRSSDLITYYIVKRSLDARKKSDIRYSYTIQAEVKNEETVLAKNKDSNVAKDRTVYYSIPENGKEELKERPVIAGFGPAGMFAGLSLARAGLKPLIIERGEDAYTRRNTVSDFWKNGKLNTASNVSFGEGGAGTFSDGKLNTLVKDVSGRNTEVLRTFVEFGADSDILYVHNPHIGTDRLIDIVTNIRKEIIRLGGEVRFNTKLEDIGTNAGKLKAIRLSTGETLECEAMILAIGHSARDTFHMLKANNIHMESKSFAVGLRIQHPQSMIDISRFGSEAEFLSPASYKLAATAINGRGVYSFCMCPGGYVIDASTEQGMKTINGMSYHRRDSGNANSAIIVTVTPDDFGSSDVLSGIEFQRRLEKSAFSISEGKIPVQLLGDYIKGKESISFGDVEPKFCGDIGFARLDESLPEYIHDSIISVLPVFDSQIKGFAREDAILAGVESRTSSPVRITRDEASMSNIEGLYPCGEGAGYAGGITSAAMDGLRIAERIISRYKRLD
ncbi:MAG: FAD-dependent oxidoreductase [Lachnospiraceae bacterium]|nr:FAD-dependent oxidoreductase [Lachnospiraceae bacterium]